MSEQRTEQQVGVQMEADKGRKVADPAYPPGDERRYARTAKPCPYCKRQARDDGSIFHEGGCAGLELVTMNRLQYDVLIGRTADETAAVRPSVPIPTVQGESCPTCWGTGHVPTQHIAETPSVLLPATSVCSGCSSMPCICGQLTASNGTVQSMSRNTGENNGT